MIMSDLNRALMNPDGIPVLYSMRQAASNNFWIPLSPRPGTFDNALCCTNPKTIFYFTVFCLGFSE